MPSGKGNHRQDAPPRPHIFRTKTGCIGCRLRRKKCDEQRPSCLGCQRNVLVCNWPDEYLDRTKELLRRGARAPVKTEDWTLSALHSSLRSHVPQTYQVVINPVPRDDCKAKLSHRSPTLDSKTMDILGSISQSLCPQALYKQSALRQPMSRVLFDHYIHRTNKTLSVCHGFTNPFIAKLLPIAISHDLILQSLLALSGVHYADLRGTPLCETTLFHYGQALQGQKYGLTSLAQGEDRTIVPLLVTALILCTIECCRGNSGALGVHHLKGARFLLQTCLRLPTSQLDEGTRSFLIQRYAYTAVLANVTLGVESDDWISDDMSLLFPMMKIGSRNSSSVISGCIHELFQLIPAVSKIARKRETEKHLQLESWDTMSSYLSLRAKILSWKPKISDEVYTICGLIYQQALLVFLASLFERFEKHPKGGIEHGGTYSPHVKAAFDNFIPLLQSVPAESPISTTLCWPLVVFGSCAKLPEHRDSIHVRLASMSTVLAPGNVREASWLLELLWARGDASLAHPFSLEAIMKEENMAIFFL